MRSTFKVLFYIKKNTPLRNGAAPIMGRITINGQRTHFSTRLSIAPTLWDVNTSRVTGRNAEAVRINSQLDATRYNIERCYNTLFHDQTFVTPLMVKEMYLGLNHRNETIVDFFRRHNEEFSRMVGISRSKTTYYKYRCVCMHLENYVNDRYGRKDLMFKELDLEFITGFHAYIVKECPHKKNTIWVYMIALKHILMLARSKGYMTKDLFANYKLHSEYVPRNYLSINEINKLMTVVPTDKTIQLVRDAFLFSCFTGLSYIDLRSLTNRNVQSESNQLWVNTTRRKTGSEVNIRLLSVPSAILMRYVPADNDTPIFNLPSNGWCNLCLDKLMAMAGITKRITFHTARHTFATTITLSQGMAIETISKLLGHRNIRTTQIYAAVTRSKLDDEMTRLSKRINTLCHAWNGNNARGRVL